MYKTILLIVSALSDLLHQHIPLYSKKKNSFAFIVHPRDLNDVYRKFPFLKHVSPALAERLLYYFWPIVVSRITGARDMKTGESVIGFMVSIPLTARQMTLHRNRTSSLIIKAAQLAEKKGARVIGLGAMTASFTHGGIDVKEYINASITTGKVYTSKTVVNITEDIAREIDRKPSIARIAIVGAGGSIGGGSAHILARRGFKNILLIDIERKYDKIKELEELLVKSYDNLNIVSSVKLESIKNSDIIVAATSHPDVLITSKHLRAGAVVVDDAQPSDVDPSVVEHRSDVLVLEGGVVHAPHINTHFNMGLKHREDIFSCLAETILLAQARDYTQRPLGPQHDFDFDELKKLDEYARASGFRRGVFQNTRKVYSDDDITHIRQLVKQGTVS